MDAVTFHRIQGASLNEVIKLMIHTNLWEATQSYVGISRTTNKNKLHILFWDDEFFDETCWLTLLVHIFQKAISL